LTVEFEADPSDADDHFCEEHEMRWLSDTKAELLLQFFGRGASDWRTYELERLGEGRWELKPVGKRAAPSPSP